MSVYSLCCSLFIMPSSLLLPAYAASCSYALWHCHLKYFNLVHEYCYYDYVMTGATPITGIVTVNVVVCVLNCAPVSSAFSR